MEERTIPSGADASRQLSGGSFTKLFKQGVKFLRPKKQVVYQLKILPAFHSGIPKIDPNFKIAYIPYRDSEGKLTSFIYKVAVNRGVGPNGMDLLSPKTFGPSEVDPCEILYMTAKNNPQYAHLVARGANRAPQLDATKDFGLMNVFSPHKPEDGVRIFMLPKSGVDSLLQQLELQPDRNMPIVQGPFGDKYQWGDITDPQYGLLMNVHLGQDPKSGFNSYTAAFQQFPGAPGINTRYTYPLTGALLNQVMALRYYIPDALNIMSNAEIVEFLCETFPRPLIEQALGQMFTLPPAKNNPAMFTPPAGGWTPPTGAPTPPAPAPQSWTPPATVTSGYPTPPPAPAQPMQAPNVPTPASSIPSPGNMPPPPVTGSLPQPPPQQNAIPGDLNIVQGSDGKWDGFENPDLAKEYRLLLAEFNNNSNAMKDMAKMNRMNELIAKRAMK